MKVSGKKIIYFLICAVIMLLPRRWFIGGIQSYRLIMLLLIIIEIKRLKFNKSFFNYFTAAYILYIAGYYLFDSGIMSCLGFIIDSVGVFIIIYSAIDTESDFRDFIHLFICCTTVYSVLCIIQTFTEFNIFDMISGVKPSVASSSAYYRFGLVRAYGSFTTSINNALFLVMGSCVILYALDNENKKKKRKRYLISYIITIGAACATMSRAPLLIIILTLACYLIKKGAFRFAKKHVLKIVSSILVIITILVLSTGARNTVANFGNMFYAVFDDSASNSIKSSFGVNVGGVGERLMLYSWVKEEIKGKEVLGVGPSSDIVFKFSDEWNKIRTKTSIENQYLKMLGYFGYLGLGLYILFTVRTFIYTIKRHRKKNELDFYYTSFMIQLAYILCVFSVASVDDMRMYFAVIALTFLSDKNNMCYSEKFVIKKEDCNVCLE